MRQVVLSDDALSADILSFGAALRSLSFEGRPMTLSLDTLSEYAERSPHCGAVAGRFANRIAHGRFALDGKSCQLSRNEAGRTHLHGGFKGFGRRNWTFRDAGPQSATLAYRSVDGEEGYPGNLEALCTYSLPGQGRLRILLEATCDQPTIVNLATHSYFNLDGSGTIVDHLLTIPAEAYLPVDADRIPIGAQASVTGTPFDFRRPRPIGDFAYDHAFVLSQQATAEPRPVARLESPKTGIMLEIASTEPAIQFYAGQMLGRAGLGAAGRIYGDRAGLCLEPQRFPDAPNQPGFPSAVLRPGEVYRQITEYRFARK